HGTAKSTTTRILGSLIDPAVPQLRAAPRSERDLAIAAANRLVVAFDNLSGIPPWLSDALCRLSTGGGFGTRELYENDEEALFDVTRPVILNGIDDIATRADLLDRTIGLSLPLVSGAARKEEACLWTDFGARHGRILGGLLNTLAGALR